MRKKLTLKFLSLHNVKTDFILRIRAFMGSEINMRSKS